MHQAMTLPWRVLVVEDDAESRNHFAAAIQRHASLQLCAAVAGVQAALQWLDKDALPLDALLCDLGLPDGSGLEVIHDVARRWPACDCMVISMFGDDANVLRSINAGAVGYIHKDAAPQDIAQSILEMKEGAAPMSPAIARGVLARCKQWSEPSGARVDVGGSEAGELLTPRESQVLDLIARGFAYVEIARIQSVSVNTVKAQIKSLYSKLAVRSKNEAVFEATRMGLLRVH